MEDIQPLRNFLKEIQGQPELIYTQVTVEHYAQLKKKLRQLHPADPAQRLLQQQVVKHLAGLLDLIRDYDREIKEAIDFLPAVTETEKKHLTYAYQKIQKTEHQVLALLAQLREQ